MWSCSFKSGPRFPSALIGLSGFSARASTYSIARITQNKRSFLSLGEGRLIPTQANKEMIDEARYHQLAKHDHVDRASRIKEAHTDDLNTFTKTHLHKHLLSNGVDALP